MKTLSIIITSLGGLLLSLSTLKAQEFDPHSFEAELNDAIAAIPGVSITLNDAPWTQLDDVMSQYEKLVEQPPDFGFVVRSGDGQAIDLIGGSVPFSTSGDSVDITGLALPAGAFVETVGRAGWIAASSEITQRERVVAPSRDIGRVVDTVLDASDYLAQELCGRASRPTQIELNLTAGFELVFNASTGSVITWNMEVVCAR